MKISFGSSGGFKFGGGSANDSAQPATGGFTFGSGAAAAPSCTSTETGGSIFRIFSPASNYRQMYSTINTNM